jgi:ribonuclease P protein component
MGQRKTKVNRFCKDDRIRRGDDFTEIIRHGAFAADDTLVVNVRRMSPVEIAGATQGNVASGVRLGITVARKTGPAVVRNRWKRWIREAFRTQRGLFPAGLEIIVRPKRDAKGSYQAICRSLPVTIGRAYRKLRSSA